MTDEADPLLSEEALRNTIQWLISYQFSPAMQKSPDGNRLGVATQQLRSLARQRYPDINKVPTQ